MTFNIETICRGSGKGYIRITCAGNPSSLRAQALAPNGATFPCQICLIGFPGEDETARRHAGDRPEGQTQTFIVVVPLLDVALTIQLFDLEETAGEADLSPVFSFVFDPLRSKIRSRLTYTFRENDARVIRDIDQKRLSGETQVFVTGIYPVTEDKVSCRFHVRYPHMEGQVLRKVSICDGAANAIDSTPIVLEDSLISDPRDASRQLHEIVYSIRVNSHPQTLCITAQLNTGAGNFTCILPDAFEGFRIGALDLTKHVSYDEGYPQWFEQHRATWADINNQREISQQWDDRPLISIVTVVFRTPLAYLKALIDSVKAQSYEHFEMILVNVSGEDQAIANLLNNINDKRFVILNAENISISDNTNIGINAAHGDYIAFVDHDDVIEPDALYRYMTVIREHPQVDMLYCDEDLLDNGTYRWPVFKPAFNPDLLYSYNYVTHMLVVSRNVLQKVELSSADVAGAQDYDLTLKCAEKSREICNVPYMLYHWRMHQNSTSTNPGSKPYAQTAGRIALERHWERVGLKAKVNDTELPFRYRTQYLTDCPKKINIVIPTKDHVDVLSNCLESVLNKTEYSNFDITLVENNSIEQRTFDYYKQIQNKDQRVKVVTWKGVGFNYSAICNYGARQSDGDIILFLNNDTEVINANWLKSMVGFFERPEVGIVGAKLLFHDDLVQHGGVWASMDHCGYFSELMSSRDGGYMETLRYSTNCAAVTGACQMIRRDLFEKIGGLDEGLAVVLNDVDLCLKADEAGYLIVFDPQAKLYHNEHTSRGRDEQDVRKEIRAIDEQAKFYAKWDCKLERGRFINANLNQYDGHFKLKW